MRPTTTELAGETVSRRIGPWLVVFEWPGGVTAGGPRHVHVVPAPDADPAEVARGVSSTVLRQVDFADATEEMRSRTAERDESLEDADRLTPYMLRKYAARGDINEQYLAVLAQCYTGYVGLGVRSVTTRLAEQADRKPETIRQHLKEARKRGLLTSIQHRAGGELTERGKAVLNDVLRAEGVDRG